MTTIRIALKTAYSEKFMGLCHECLPEALYPDSVMVHCSGPDDGEFAQWDLELLENGRYAFKSPYSGKYMGLCRECIDDALYDDSVMVHCSGPDDGDFAQWEIEPLANGKFGIKSPYNGKYMGLCHDCIDGAMYDDSVMVHCSGPDDGDFAQWEIFDISSGELQACVLPVTATGGQSGGSTSTGGTTVTTVGVDITTTIRVALKTAYSEKFMGLCHECLPDALYEDSVMVHCSGPDDGEFAQWDLEVLANGRYAFRSPYSGKYMGLCHSCIEGAMYEDSVMVHCSGPNDGEFAQWEIEALGNGRYGIRSPYNGKYMGLCHDCIDGAMYDDSVMVHCSGPDDGDFAQWEIFEIASGQLQSCIVPGTATGQGDGGSSAGGSESGGSGSGGSTSTGVGVGTNGVAVTSATTIRVALKTAYSEKFMGLCHDCVPDALYEDSVMVHCSGPDDGDFAQWDLEVLTNGRYAFRSPYNGMYMGLCHNCIEGAMYEDSVMVHCSGPGDGDFAQWEIEALENGRFGIRSPYSGKYMGLCRSCIEGAMYEDSVMVHCSGPDDGDFAQWEIFTIAGGEQHAFTLPKVAVTQGGGGSTFASLTERLQKILQGGWGGSSGTFDISTRLDEKQFEVYEQRQNSLIEIQDRVADLEDRCRVVMDRSFQFEMGLHEKSEIYIWLENMKKAVEDRDNFQVEIIGILGDLRRTLTDAKLVQSSLLSDRETMWQWWTNEQHGDGSLYASLRTERELREGAERELAGLRGKVTSLENQLDEMRQLKSINIAQLETLKGDLNGMLSEINIYRTQIKGFERANGHYESQIAYWKNLYDKSRQDLGQREEELRNERNNVRIKETQIRELMSNDEKSKGVIAGLRADYDDIYGRFHLLNTQGGGFNQSGQIEESIRITFREEFKKFLEQVRELEQGAESYEVALEERLGWAARFNKSLDDMIAGLEGFAESSVIEVIRQRTTSGYTVTESSSYEQG
ncbi:MAG: hypothetical protein AAF614_01695 [Chloroflexota bacterium]